MFAEFCYGVYQVRRNDAVALLWFMYSRFLKELPGFCWVVTVRVWSRTGASWFIAVSEGWLSTKAWKFNGDWTRPCETGIVWTCLVVTVVAIGGMIWAGLKARGGVVWVWIRTGNGCTDWTLTYFRLWTSCYLAISIALSLSISTYSEEVAWSSPIFLP